LNKAFRGPLVYILAIAAVFLLISSFNWSQPDTKQISYKPDFLQMVKEDSVKAVAITTNYTEIKLVGLTKNTKYTDKAFPENYDFYTYIPSLDVFTSDILAASGKANIADVGFTIKYEPAPQPSFLEQALPYIIPLGLVLIFWFYIMRQSQTGGNKALSFGKSRARMATDDKNKKTFNDVAGADEEKEELKEIVDFLKNPKRFLELGARIPKGVLLVGPPGGGKTLLAKAVAGEAGVPFFSISGSDFVEMFVGVGASRVRDLFDTAKKNSPAIVFIDEIDAVGRHRGAGLGGGHDEREQTLNQLLVEMDGFNVNEGIIILAATNRKDILDPALLRPGRFDRQVFVNYPDIKGREEILKVHSRGKPLSGEIDLKVLAKRTPGFTGADLENVLNEAAILTARNQHTVIGMLEIEEAITRVIAGPEKKSRVITEKDKRCTAIHEVGHAICAKVLPNCDPVHEISIIPRGQAAGYTLTLPEEDDRHVFMSKMVDDICMMLGGRAAEKLVLSDVSTGAISDLQRATETAKSMVIKFGMSEEIGPVFLGGEEEIFVGKEFGHTKNYSEELAARIDREVRRILEDAFSRAMNILKEHMHKLNLISTVLLEKEKLDGDEFISLFEGQEA
jgi:cell division protease FtsH